YRISPPHGFERSLRPFGVGFFRSFCCLRRKDLTAKVAKVPQRSQRSQAHWDSSPWDSVLVNPPQFCENKILPTRLRRNQGKELKLVNDSFGAHGCAQATALSCSGD